MTRAVAAPTRRSDRIRQRHTEQVHKPPVKNRQRTARAGLRTPPPVVSRTPMVSVPGRAQHRLGVSRPRRRYDIVQGVRGAEVRLPSLPQINVGWRVVSLALVIFLSAALYMLWNSPRFRVESAQVDGLQRISDADVNAILKLNDQPVFTVDPHSLERHLQEAFPEFQAVTVTLKVDNTLAVSVTERLPVLAWRYNGHTDLVDPQGMTFPMRAGDETRGLPLVEAKDMPPLLLDQPLAEALSDPNALLSAGQPISNTLPGTTPRQLLTPELVAGVLALYRQIPPGVSLQYTAEHGFGWKDPGGWNVSLGDASQTEMKLKVYRAIIQRIAQDEELQPDMVSVEYLHAPYFTVSQRSEADSSQ